LRLGVYLGWLTELTGSALPAVVCHVINNALFTMLTALWGTLDEIREDIRRYADAGLTELFLEGNFTLADQPIDRALGVMEQLAPR